MVIDLLSAAFKSAWSDASNGGIVPVDAIYFGRPQQPSGPAGFPYIGLLIREVPPEVTQRQRLWLCRYDAEIVAWTVQGMTGGATAGDQVTDQGNILRAVEAIMRSIPPNEPWYTVNGFAHVLPGPVAIDKDDELFQGADVYTGVANYQFLVYE